MALPPSGLAEALRAWHKVNSEGASSDKADAASRAGEFGAWWVFTSGWYDNKLNKSRVNEHGVQRATQLLRMAQKCKTGNPSGKMDCELTHPAPLSPWLHVLRNPKGKQGDSTKRGPHAHDDMVHAARGVHAAPGGA